MAGSDNLRVSFVAGGLNKGGAEKQFLYMLRALQEMGAAVQVLTLTAGEFHENSLAGLGIQPVYVGSNPVQRLVNIQKAARSFQAHFLQASHFFASFYVGMAGRLAGIPSIGAIRSDLYLDLQGMGRRGPWLRLLRLPTALLANSKNARANALQLRLPARRVFVVQNVIDLEEYDHDLASSTKEPPLAHELLEPGRIRAITVARLVPVKRLERFLAALSLARQAVPALQGIIAGNGPEEASLRALAARLDLRPDHPDGGVLFLGERGDIPQLFGQSAMCVLTSDREGFPNVLLEAMAAALPVISTPAGEARELVRDGENGFLVPFDDAQALADRLVRLSQSGTMRRSMGSQGRRYAEQQFAYPRLAPDLLELYQAVARQANARATLRILTRNGVAYNG